MTEPTPSAESPAETATDTTQAEYEAMYAEQPERYRWKVRRFMWLGYGYVGGVILLLLGFVIGGSYLFFSGTLPLTLADNFLKIGIPALLLGAVIVRGFFVRIPLPDGHRLSGDLKKQVIDFFEPTRKLCKGPRLDEVFVDTEMNAAVQQNRAFGIVGPTRNYLILGAPLLELATEQEIRAIIAHEFGHLNRAHGKMGAAVYRLNSTLYNSARAIEEKSDSGTDGIAFKFFRWFIPKFDELTFAMRRGQEYEADRTAVAATSKEAIASALCRLYALDEPIDLYWENTWHAAREHASVSSIRPYQAMRDGVYERLTEEGASSAIEQSLRRNTDFSDTHPCLRERLESIGAQPVTQFSCEHPAINSIFTTDSERELQSIVTEQWRSSAGDNWQRIHSEHQASNDELERLRTDVDSLNGDDLLRLASLEEHYGDKTAAISLFDRSATAHPDSSAAQYHSGRTLLADDFDKGQRRLMSAARLDDTYLSSVNTLLHHEYTERGLSEELANLEKTIDAYNSKQQVAQSERNGATLQDSFSALTLADEQRSQLNALLDARPGVLGLYLVEKEVQHYPDSPVYLAGVDLNYYSDDVNVNQDRWLEVFVDELEAQFSDSTTVLGVVLDDDHSAWKERLVNIPGALMHEKQKVSWVRKSLLALWGALKRFVLLAAVIFVGVILFMLADNMGLFEMLGLGSLTGD